MKKTYKNLDIIREDVKDFIKRDDLEWMMTHCLKCEIEPSKYEENIYTVDIEFGSDDEDEGYHTKDDVAYDLGRRAIGKFVTLLLDAKWGHDANYNVDSLAITSDGDEEDFILTVYGSVFYDGKR